MKGQLTIEYLFLALISLALLSISISALLKIKEVGDHAYHLEMSKSTAMDIYNAGEELCAMGSGNSIRLRVRETISISYSSNEVLFSNNEIGFQLSKQASCPYIPKIIFQNSEILIENDGGNIRIS